MHLSWSAARVAAEESQVFPAAGCVVDVTLSLRPCGLFWTLSLAETMPVWLPQGHWALVEGEAYTRDERVTCRLGGASGAAGASAFRAAVREWAMARTRLRLEGRPNVFWTADSWTESVVPKDDDPGLLDRRDALAAALDVRLLSRGAPGKPCSVADLMTVDTCRDYAAPDILADCARDTLALSASLKGPRPMVLTAMAEADDAPSLVQWLDRAGIPCKRLETGAVREAVRWQLAPALLRSGLAVPVEAGRLRLAGLMLVAPRVAAATLDESLDWDAASAVELREFWNDASAIWWEAP